MTPAYLSGNLAPVPDEIDGHDLPVTGVLPPELTGRYFRNGPNPRPGEDPGHWFAGHGMLHGVRLRDGRAEWYRNRWVKTKKFTEDAPLVTSTGIDLTAGSANTSVIRHADRILALVETSFPHEVSRDLDTIGPVDFGGKLTTGMTAHPKQDPITGELHFFGYGFFPPYLTYHRLSKAGELVESKEIEVPGSTMVHDFAITEHFLVWLDLPLTFQLDRGGMPYAFDDAYGARIGLTPRAGGTTTWFDVDPCYVFHVGNAYEDAQGRVVLSGARYAPEVFKAVWGRIGGATDPASKAAVLGGAVLHRWTLDPASGAAKEEALDDRSVEFPTFNDDRMGLSSRYLYTVGDGAIVKYDDQTGSALTLDVGGSAGEAVFVPAEGGTSEDDGWLMSIATSGESSRLLVHDAHDLKEVASVRLPRRVPAGFHGKWLED
ncbi:carotenoid oxygenase family protein [Nonomuraea sp. NPDC050556]|uniref:carotenoid oxygenase family protein n=1 Tax=Nonomuraea sp. NPDC050556 TaxID=3364369 RepID=UPI0037B4B3A7